MAILEVEGLLQVKDKENNVNVIYPVTRAKLIEGLEELLNEQLSELKITTDSALSATSENPVQNKVIKAELNKKADAQTVADELAKKLDKSGGTMTGLLILSGDPTAAKHAATKGYVDNAIGSVTKGMNEALEDYLPLAGGTMSGPLTLSGAPTANLHAATKKYVDDQKPTRVTVSLSADGWAQDSETGLYEKTVTVTGVSATETAQMIHVVPTAASQTAYLEAGVYASAQAANAITFAAASIPESVLTVYVVIESI